MTIDAVLKKRLKVAFAALNNKGALHSLPPPLSLVTALEAAFTASGGATTTVPPRVGTYFATASVEMWLRAVHSFLISASLTRASPIWASVTGYYSSHYAVRALAHLLGHFQLFNKKRLVTIALQQGRHVCAFDSKKASDREHKVYWKFVKEYTAFKTDPLFTNNNPATGDSDVGHRDRANYADHLFQYDAFRALDHDTVRARINAISDIEFSTPPIPALDKFPDIESVQVVAYHRVVKFRQFLDEVLGGENRFWNVHRNPPWTTGLIDFQLVEQPGPAAIRK